MALFDMKDLARRGAQTRITELQQELEAIYRAFPDLRQRGRNVTATAVVNDEEQYGRRSQTRPAAQEPSLAQSPRRGRKRKMTAAERKAVSERMRKYWESRRAEAGTKKR